MTSASASPKRKRGQETHLETRVILSQQLFAHDVDEEDTGSPRTKVARKFDGLEIDNDLFTLQHNHTSSSPRPCQTAQLSATSADATSGRSIDAKSMMPTQPPSTSSPAVAGNAQSISAASLAPKSRSGSPPLAGELSDQFWHDSEITGHDPDPDDPDDDLYGINGVGFRPTAAIAWSRSRRRKQQLEEYKNREAREARQQRSERRKRGISDSEDVPSLDNSPRKSVRVHFEDG